MMTNGIYIVGNEKVTDNALTLLASLRLKDPEIPIFLIPFDQNYRNLYAKANALYNVQLFPDLHFLDELTQAIGDIFPQDFLALPNKMRKLAAWFGPLDEFLYIDTDIVWFEPILDTLKYLKEADFICCDYHFKGRQLQDIFSDHIIQQNIFTEQALEDVFNSGFWGATKGSITLEQMYNILKDAAQHREYFDFSGGTTDQPIMNYLILTAISRRLNLAKVNPHEPGSWGGSSHFEERNHTLYDGKYRLRYLHWAGIQIRPGCPYWDIWKYYRTLNDPTYVEPTITPSPKISWKQSLKGLFKGLKPSQN